MKGITYTVDYKEPLPWLNNTLFRSGNGKYRAKLLRNSYGPLLLSKTAFEKGIEKQDKPLQQ
ncbi:MAG TPA: hypothetical protein VF622_09940 [Segetibacter sp.]|jgi:hypothetical protein